MRLLLTILMLVLLEEAVGGLIREPPDPDQSSPDAGSDDKLVEGDPYMLAFTKGTPHIPAAALQKISSDLLKESQEEKEQAAEEAGKCIINWSAPCPKTWRVKENIETQEKECIAPKDYNGVCKTAISFELYGRSAKQNWASSCQVEWPCKGDVKSSCPSGKRDYSQPCPEGFALLEDEESCFPDLSQYDGDCPGKVCFMKFSDVSKKSWGEICGANWPCMDDCVGQYDSLCPVSWVHVGNYRCKASDHYKKMGPCDSSWSFKYYTDAMKKHFEAACKVRFPCENTCEKDYSAACPTGWQLQKGACIAPADFKACSMTSQSFEEYSNKEKSDFENECDVDWPCKKRDFCERNWDLPCPEGWEVIPPGGISPAKLLQGQTMQGFKCAPPPNYHGACKDTEEFASTETKRKWASTCDHPWPCIDATKKLSFADIVLHPTKAIAANPPPTASKNEATLIKGPRPPYKVVDRRELGKHGPVLHETGEVMPHKQHKHPTQEDLYGKGSSFGYTKPPKPTTSAAIKPGYELEEFNANQLAAGKEAVMSPTALKSKPYDEGPQGYYGGGHFMLGSNY